MQAEDMIDELRATIDTLNRAIDDQIQWLTGIMPEIANLQMQNDGMCEFIVESLQSGVQSSCFVMVIQNSKREFLADLKIDISKYVTSDSPVFDIIMAAGYKSERLCNLDYAIQTVFKFNYCLPYMPMWRVIIPRISKLARNQKITNVDWGIALEMLKKSCNSNDNYIRHHCDSGIWTTNVRDLFAALDDARVR
jgi:hypothetical protein